MTTNFSPFFAIYEIAAGQIGARRRTIEALPCISLNKSWLSGLVHGVGFDPGDGSVAFFASTSKI